MAKKMYFVFRPEDFEIYDTVSREGELKFKSSDPFDMSDPFFDKLIFEAPKKSIKGTIKAKDMVTKTKIKIKVVPETEEKYSYIKAYSNKFNLVSLGYIKPEEAIMENSAVTGFFNELNEDDETKEDYVRNVVGFYTIARNQKAQYLKDEEGPDKKVVSDVRKLTKRIK